ncbi:8-O-methyltransferase [Kibdelosporangium banguiense]|uniref:8-O-methyltransferase n=1 Tax=Kibdelosporangium banguiense TaxID=1365924 RepID=A0ABS4TFD6_9PSEU|nr:methyltransferase [Kibdelosporangium banguiense]MBP2323133.1 8-O-methyltransferase [Kibdelosporangium banguiense]
MSTSDYDVDPSPIHHFGDFYFAYNAMLAGIEIGLFDLLAGAPATAEQIEQRLGLHPRLTGDFLDSLVAMGFLERDGEQYTSTSLSDHYLRSGSPTTIVRYLKGAQSRWQRLPEALKTGEPLVRVPTPGATMDNLREGKDDWRLFFAWADYLAELRNRWLAGEFDWSGITDLVDFGGGNGSAAAYIARENPHIHATVFDLPNAKVPFDERMAELDMTDKVSFHAGDFFVDPLPEADAVLLGGMLIDWSEDQRADMLRAVYDALRPGGLVLSGSHLIDDDRREHLASMTASLNIALVSQHGRVPRIGEGMSWLQRGGFLDVRAQPLGEFETLLIGRKPQGSSR